MKIDRKHFYPKIPTGAQISTQRPTLDVEKLIFNVKALNSKVTQCLGGGMGYHSIQSKIKLL